jgi:hypothetical protein
MTNVDSIYELDSSVEYPWAVAMRDLPMDFSIDWFEDHAIHCCKVGRRFFFTREEDRLLFLMRWTRRS